MQHVMCFQECRELFNFQERYCLHGLCLLRWSRGYAELNVRRFFEGVSFDHELEMIRGGSSG